MNWPMLILKALVIGVSTVFLTELAKRNPYASAVIIAFPIMTAFAMALLYIDTGQAAQSYKLGFSTFWMILASTSFFLFLFIGKKLGLGFWLTFVSSIIVAAITIVALTLLLKAVGIDLLKQPDKTEVTQTFD